MGWAFTNELVLVGGHPGLFLSRDGGRTFVTQNDGLPATDIHALGAGGGVIYAASPQIGVMASTDGARTWQVRTRQAGQAFMGRILVEPRNPQHLLAPDMGAGAVESTDGGRTWRVLGGVQGAMWISWDPKNTRHLIAAGSTVAESIDGGESWTPLNVPLGTVAVEMSPSSPDTLLAARLEGTTAVLFVSDDAGGRWKRL